MVYTFIFCCEKSLASTKVYIPSTLKTDLIIQVNASNKICAAASLGILLIKKLEIDKTKATQYTTFKTDIIKVVFEFQFFYYKKIPGKEIEWGLAAVIQLYMDGCANQEQLPV